MTRMERDVGIAVETLTIFVRFWLTTTPALPEPAAQSARAKAGERYEAFIAALGRGSRADQSSGRRSRRTSIPNIDRNSRQHGYSCERN